MSGARRKSSPLANQLSRNLKVQYGPLSDFLFNLRNLRNLRPNKISTNHALPSTVTVLAQAGVAGG